MKLRRIWSAMPVLGSLLLLATSYFHFTGLSGLETFLQATDDGFYKRALPSLWLLPSAHWMIFAIISFVLVVKSSAYVKIILPILGALLIVDAGLMFLLFGPFIGQLMLLVSGMTFIGVIFSRTEASR